ncbi:MAG: acyl-CoA dehydrogenase [Desulfobacterales bacterium]|nr:acyl-CoA dehydrogenase [Desulfobacterales bacterium]MBF0396930.1 acyl-CoA dehydrogenase [Desulfobacterales bacterium]
MILLNPKKHIRKYQDEKSRQIMLKTIEFFENKGLKRIKKDWHEKTWNYDFVNFLKENEIFATLMTPSGYGAEDSRWDTYRNCEFSEITGFYGITYWYTWQVSMLGLGPIWMGSNEEVKHKTAKLLQEGGVFAFGLSEKEHGADIYSSDMMLYPQPDGTYRANGDKYYIGNGNEAALVSTFAKIADTGDYVFFVVNSKHEKYECVRNVVNEQNYVAEYALHDYPITEGDILQKGQKAWDDMLNTINVCKFNLGWGAIGVCTHAFYESIDHAANRNLYGKFVTDFPHVQNLFTESYCRLVAMKLFAERASDYMRSASSDDRRYLLYNPMVKMKVTREGEDIIRMLHDIIAAKGFENEPFFEIAAHEIGMLPKLEGTVHVNMALIVKFMANYFFSPKQYPEIPRRDDASNDSFLFNQGKTKGLSSIQFHDYNIAYNLCDLPNINVFKDQIKSFKKFLIEARPDEKQSKDIDYLLALGEILTLVAYGQLILENKKIFNVEDDLIDEIFDFMVRDFSKYALNIHTKPSNTEKQKDLSLKIIKTPVPNPKRSAKIWKDHVYAMKGQYKLNN